MRGHVQARVDDDDADGEQRDGADLHEGREVVARREQQPHRQHRGDEAVDHERHADGAVGVDEEARQRRVRAPRRRPPAASSSSTTPAMVAPRIEPGRTLYDQSPMPMAMGTVHRIEKTPQALSLSEFTTTSAMAASATVITKMMAMAVAVRGQPADLLARDVGERAAAAAHRGDEDDEVVHAAGQHRADQQPEEAGQVAELRGQHRADQRAGAGDGGEVVAEQHQRVHGHVVVPVARGCGRGWRAGRPARPPGRRGTRRRSGRRGS